MNSRGRPPLLSEETILQKALAAFAKFGYQAMSVRALNADLGLSHETISKRFGSKTDLFQSAVKHGVDLLLSDFNKEIERSAPDSDLELLRATVRAFMVVTAKHPTLGELLHHESIDEEQRSMLITQSGLYQKISEVVLLLQRLQDSGQIRETRIRDLWFLSEGAAGPLHSRGLSQMFDSFDGPLHADTHIDHMAETIMRSMLP